MKKYILVILLAIITFPIFAQSRWNSALAEKEKIETELKIYPNPCKNSKVTVDFNANEITEIKLTNITGKQVFVKKYTFPTYKTQILVDDIPNGIYLIQVKTSTKNMVVKKLIISRH